MNILIIKPEELEADGRAVLTGARARYVYEFHALKSGLTIKAGLLNALVGSALVEKVSMTEIVLTTKFNQPALPLQPLNVLLALTRPQILKKVLSVICELGVSRLTLVAAERSQKSHLTSHILRTEDLEYFLIKGLEQSGSSILPEVIIRHSLGAALLEIPAGQNQRLLAHAEEGAYSSVAGENSPKVSLDLEQKISAKDPVLIAVGPEAGWTQAEVSSFHAHAFTQVFLGQRILRVDTALAFLAGQVAQLRV